MLLKLNRSAISLILPLVTFSFVKVFSESKSRFSLMNFLEERARNLFLMLFSLSNQRKLMLKVLANHEALMLILALLIKLLLLLSHKPLNKVDILKVVISKKYISSACREWLFELKITPSRSVRSVPVLPGHCSRSVNANTVNQNLCIPHPMV